MTSDTDDFGQIPDKGVLSTGELANICGMTKHTIITAIERGELVAYRTPGGHNRIERDAAIAFMQRRGILPPTDGPRDLVLVTGGHVVPELIRKLFDINELRIHVARSQYGAGKFVERHQPDVIVIECDAPDFCWAELSEDVRHLNRNGSSCGLLALVPAGADWWDDSCLDGIGVWVAKPFTLEELRCRIEELLLAEEVTV